MRTAIAGLLTALIFVCAGTAAPAASTSPVILKAGVYVESNAATNSNGVFAAGGDYLLHQGSALQPIDIALYADLFGSSGGFGVSVRNSGKAYIGGGVGLYHVSLTPPYAGPAGLFGSYQQPTYTASGAGAKLFGGFGLLGGVSLELAYHFTPNAGSYQTNFASAELTFHL